MAFALLLVVIGPAAELLHCVAGYVIASVALPPRAVVATGAHLAALA